MIDGILSTKKVKNIGAGDHFEGRKISSEAGGDKGNYQYSEWEPPLSNVDKGATKKKNKSHTTLKKKKRIY
ncbi:MAG: hypothetical protein GF353_26970 [Candidatus Lokiarchaeota archaeon]|nr:hypothetical protein [Candidatus Lokiarchaeota archaeon]